MTTRTTVTVLGLGPMGHALAEAFLTNGHPTTVWNRTPGKAAGLVTRGARLAATAADAVAASDLVIVCVQDYEVVHRILDPAVDALRGRTLVNLTAGAPDAARKTAAWAAEHGADYLDGAIMTPIETINTPDAVLLYSGPAELYERHRPALDALGGTATFLGTDPGRAAAHEVALLDLFWTSVAGMVHAFALARAENISGAELAPLAKGIGQLLPSVIDDHAARLDAGRFDGDLSTIASAASALAHIVETAETDGVDAGVQRAALALFRRAVDAGQGGDGIARLAQHL
jgi:3-hydroxyisobutyrate dehydrogenase-like beta-hydroxyacid dehydrogenase